MRSDIDFKGVINGGIYGLTQGSSQKKPHRSAMIFIADR
jgi:hypothetical protein